MTLSDAEIIERIRETLSTWAAEEPVPDATLTPLVELSPAVPVRRRKSAWWVAAAAALVAVVVAAAIVVNLRDDPPTVVDDGQGPSAITEIPVGHSFGVRGVAVTDDAVWVTSQFDEELYRIDPASDRVVDTFAIPDHVEGVRAVAGWLWLSRYDPHEVIRVDPATGALTTRLAFDSQPNLASDGERLWVIAERGGESKVVEIDPSTAAQIGEIPLGAPPGFATVDGGSLWVANMGTTTVSRVDLAGGRVTAIDLGAEPRSVVAAGGSIWVGVNRAEPEQSGSIVQIDPATADATSSVATGRWIHSLAASGDLIWATNFLDGTVSVVDARGGELIATSPIGNRPGGLATGHGSVWVTPHRRNVLLRIDPSQPLEAAAEPDIARTVVGLGRGATHIRCSGRGSPTVVLEGNQAEGPQWAVVEARLSRSVRVCVHEPVGVDDPTVVARSGSAADAAADLTDALDTVGEHGPFVVVGQWIDGFDAQMFAAGRRDDVVGLVLVNGVGADYFDRVRSLLPAEARARMDQDRRDEPDLRWLDESAAQLAAIEGFGDLPLVVLVDVSPEPLVMAATSDPPLTVAESEAINRLLGETRRELASRSTAGRVITTAGQVSATDIVDATMPLLG